MTTSYISLGSNLGDRRQFFNHALVELAADDSVEITAMSNVIETKALGDCDQPDFLNAVVRLETQLPCTKLHQNLVAIENKLARQRDEKWGPRTIDLDILLYGNEIIRNGQLTVPHNQMHLRSFVLDGMCELKGELVHPVLKKSMYELAKRLNGNNYSLDSAKPQLISVAGVIGVGKTTLASALAKDYDCPMLAEAYDTNPYLADVYAGEKQLALDSQLYFLKSRVDQLNQEALKAGGVVISDYVFDKELIYARHTLSKKQLTEYRESYKALSSKVAQPVLVIYLQDSAQACLERIRKRNRQFEHDIDINTLESFIEEYEIMFSDWSKCPVIRIDMKDFDSFDKSNIERLTRQVENYICMS